MQIEQLAKEMGVTVGDMIGFIECLRVWVEKGMTFEEAIAAHMKQMTRLAESAANLPKSIVVESYDELRERAYS